MTVLFKGKINIPWLIVFLVMIVVMSIPLITSDNLALSLIITAAVWSVATMGFSFILRTGQFSLGQAGLMMIGGYTSALLCSKLGVSFFLSLPLAGLMAALVAFLIGMVVLRLGGIYFAIITLALGEILRVVADQWQSLTGGALGLAVPPPAPLVIGGLTINFVTSNVPYYYIAVLIVIISALVYWRMDASPLGRTFRSVAVNPVLAEHQGIYLMKYRVMAFTVAGFFTGIVGAFFANNLHYIGPHVFGFGASVQIVMMTMIGGMSSVVFGPIIGATVLSMLSTYISFMGIAGLVPLLFGGLVLAFLLIFRGIGIGDIVMLFIMKLRIKIRERLQRA
jgi:branched-chain amino acid transport system permease protein